jgi:formate C-acetyltransferase
MMQSRAQFLKQRLLDAPFQVCPERAVLWTESMAQSEGKPQVIRNALAFQHLLGHMTVAIRPGELIVGSRTSNSRWPTPSPA